MIKNALFVRLEAKPGEEKELAQLLQAGHRAASSCTRRFVKGVTYGLVLLASAAATAGDPPLPTQVVDLANKLNGGDHPGFRAFHAKGVVVEGSFKSSPEAAQLSRATLFNGRTIPVTVRFSDGNGMRRRLSVRPQRRTVMQMRSITASMLSSSSARAAKGRQCATC
jgi:hypothetical protein